MPDKVLRPVLATILIIVGVHAASLSIAKLVVGTEKASRDQAGRTPRWRLPEARRPGVDIIAGANLARRTVNLPLSIVKIRLWLPGWFVVARPAASRKNAVPYGGDRGFESGFLQRGLGANSTPRLRLGISKRSPKRDGILWLWSLPSG